MHLDVDYLVVLLNIISPWAYDHADFRLYVDRRMFTAACRASSTQYPQFHLTFKFAIQRQCTGRDGAARKPFPARVFLRANMTNLLCSFPQ